MIASRRAAFASVLVAIALGPSVAAHVGSPDVFLDGQAGPYRVLVTVRPPQVIPGVTDVEIRTTASDVRDVRVVPLPLAGAGARFAPVPDVAARSPADSQLFTAHLWMMTAGAWQVRLSIDGDRGRGDLSIPVPTLPKSTLGMGRALGVLLFLCMLVLGVGFVSIVSAMAREARLGPGEVAGPAGRRRGRIAGALAAAVVVFVVMLGNLWWTAEASNYGRYVYKPLEATVSVAESDARLTLALRDPGWILSRRIDDFILDHDHLMHLFIVTPALDRLWHLHPNETGTGTFAERLPDMPAGRYELFADLVHQTGLSETVTAEIDMPAVRGTPLAGDDSQGPTTSDTRIVWVRDAQPLTTRRLTMFTFRVEDQTGRPATDLELYMGMQGHAIFIRRDRRVFAHVHPGGSAPMAALEIGRRSLPASDSPPVHAHHVEGLPSTVTFPYGFPEPGDYRIFVQIKRAGRIETAVFDAHVA